MRPTRGIAATLAGVLLAGVLSSCVTTTPAECGSLVSHVKSPTTPLLGWTMMGQRPEARRDRLVHTAAGWGAPFGPVIGGVDYDYGQWLHLYPAGDNLLATTKRNAALTVLRGADLTPLFALRPATQHVAWEADSSRMLLLSLPLRQPIQVQSFDGADGAARWCTPLLSRFEAGDPIATSLLDDGSTLVAAKSGSSAEVVRLDSEGQVGWRSQLPSVDQVGWLGMVGNQVVVGGRPAAELRSTEIAVPDAPAITGVDATTGQVIWRYSSPRDDAATILGAHGTQLILFEGGASSRLVALRLNGRPVWTHKLPASSTQAVLRGDTVVVRTAHRLRGFSSSTGEPMWTLKIPAKPTFAPYGFTLASVPALDDTHLLLPGTKALHVLDVYRGTMHDYRLPVDGVSTTYWPYQLLVTDRLVGVVTNIGAVVMRRGR